MVIVRLLRRGSQSIDRSSETTIPSPTYLSHGNRPAAQPHRGRLQPRRRKPRQRPGTPAVAHAPSSAVPAEGAEAAGAAVVGQPAAATAGSGHDAGCLSNRIDLARGMDVSNLGYSPSSHTHKQKRTRRTAVPAHQAASSSLPNSRPPSPSADSCCGGCCCSSWPPLPARSKPEGSMLAFLRLYHEHT